jgi:hypothetical protein
MERRMLQILLGYMIWAEMYGNGVKIITVVHFTQTKLLTLLIPQQEQGQKEKDGVVLGIIMRQPY